jgi:predicted RNase H-like nuclease (RuvC/YqgF family)
MLNMNDISDIIPREGNEELQGQINRLEVLLSEADKNVEMKDRQMDVLKKTCKTLENHTEMQKKRINYLEDKVRSLEN